MNAFSCFEYDGIVRDCIRKAKYGSRKFAALKILALYGFTYARNCGLNYSGFIVVPIPISKERYKERGFNQSEILAKVFGKIFDLKILNEVLIRSRNTAVQHANTREKRFKNIESAFEINSKSVGVVGSKVILIDDIVTSGATFLEAAKVLYNAGATEVRCISLSRRLLKKV